MGIDLGSGSLRSSLSVWGDSQDHPAAILLRLPGLHATEMEKIFITQRRKVAKHTISLTSSPVNIKGALRRSAFLLVACSYFTSIIFLTALNSPACILTKYNPEDSLDPS